MAIDIKKSILSFLNAPTKEQLEESNTEIAQLKKVIETQKTVMDNFSYQQDTNPSGLAIESEPQNTTQNTGIRVPPILLQKLFFNNQYVFRSVNIRADELVTRGYKITGGDKQGNQLCSELILNSGGTHFLKQWSINTDIWGNGWIEKNYSLDKKRILKLSFIHPATFGWKTIDQNSNIIKIGRDKQPVGCQQKTVDENGIEKIIDVSKDKVELLTFIKVADEFIGVGIVQPIYATIDRLMRMEGAAAEAAVKAANPVWVGIFDTVSEHTVRKWGMVLGKLTTKEQVFLPKGTDIKLISPERQLFSEYSEYYINSIVAGTGVPKSLLLGGEGSNRAESIVLSRHFQSTIESNQSAEEMIINRIFKEYGKLSGFDAPAFIFNEIVEDADLMSDKVVKLFEAGIISVTEARQMIGIEESSKDVDFKNTPVIDKPSIESDIKDSDMKQWHPESPESPEAGSQQNIKKKAKRSTFSTTKE